MTDFGIKTVRAWNVEQANTVATRLRNLSEEARAGFADFRTASDLSAAWQGDAADAAGTSVRILAADLYELSDGIGLLATIITRKTTAMAEAQSQLRHAVTAAETAGYPVGDDGRVGIPHDKLLLAAHLPPDEPSNPRTVAADHTRQIVAALQAAALADLDLSRALGDAEATVAKRSQQPDVVAKAVAFDGRGSDPFLADVNIDALPKPGSDAWGLWFAALTPLEKQLVLMHLGDGFDTSDFHPYTTIQPGGLPDWAKKINSLLCSAAADGLPDGASGYGYFGGGTIAGPGGVPWPIVMPYYTDGKHMFMAETSGPGPNGGINQLDGHDPSWHTVADYTGLGVFGSITTGTKLATALLITTGQDLDANPTDPGIVSVGRDGRPTLSGAPQPESRLPPDKQYWDVDSDSMFPKPINGAPVGAIQPNLEYNSAALGANNLVLQGANANYTVSHTMASHTDRQWYVDYQVNDDGRIRAIVHTYTAGPLDGGKTQVASFANAFPTGQHGSTTELLYSVRDNSLGHQAYLNPANQIFLGDPTRGGGPASTPPFHEILNK